MAFKRLNRARMTTATTGTGTMTLGAAVGSAAKGYFTDFATAGLANGDTVRYVIEDGANWEIGIGTYTFVGTTLSRDTVHLSSAGGSTKISLSGTADVYASISIEDFALLATVASPTFTGAVTLAQDPVNPLEAVTKQYADALATGLDPKASVRAATTAALAANTRTGNVLTASANGAFPAQDGVTLALNERIIVKNEATTANNGIYYLSVVGTGGTPWQLTRAADMDAWTEVPGSYAWVEEGTVNGDTAWVATANTGGTLNTTAITWSQFGGAGAYQAASATLTSLSSASANGVSLVTAANYAAMLVLLGALTAASQSDQETATSNTVAVTPGTQQFHPSAAKFWALVDASGATLSASYNLTSRTDTGAGDLTLTIATDFSSAAWVLVYAFNGFISATGSAIVRADPNPTKAAGTVRIVTRDNSAAAQDPSGPYNVAGFGDQ